MMVLYFIIDPLSDGLLLLNDIREMDPCDLQRMPKLVLITSSLSTMYGKKLVIISSLAFFYY